MSSRQFALGSIVLIAVALFLRWPHPEFQWQHVDERAFVTVPLGFWGGDYNPHFFNYPTLQFYLISAFYLVYFLVFSSESVDQFLAYRYFVDATDLIVLARVGNTLFAVASVFVVIQAGRRIYGDRGALAAGLALAVLPLHVRFSHLAITDTPATFWVSLSLLGAIGIVQEGRLRDYLLAGICAGLAGATKYPGGLILVTGLAAALLREPTLRRPGLWIISSSALVAFALATPYVWLDLSGFWADFSAMGADHFLSANGGEDALVYHLRYTAFYGMGLAVVTPALAAIVWRPRDWRHEELLLLIFILVFTILLVVAGSVFMRYTLPLLPALVLLLYRPFDRLHSRKALLAVWIGLLLLEPAQASWKLRTQLSGPDTRIEAQQWLYHRQPGGGRIAHLSDAGPITTVSPNSVLDRQRHFLNSFSLDRLIDSYQTLGSRSDLPPFYVSLPIEAFEQAVSSAATGATEAILFSYDHPLIGRSARQTAGDLGPPIERLVTHVGDLSGAAYDWVDLYFLPVGGRYTLERSGPEIRADVYPATITEPVPTSSEYFALLTHLLRGNRFVEAGDWAKAALELELIQRTPFRMNELVSKAYLYNLSLGLGMIHYRDGSLDAALKDWRIATEIHPSKAVAYFHVGEALRNLGQFEKAAEHYLLALERASGNAHLLHQLGVGFMKMGQFGTSIEILNRAAGLRADADIYVNLGVAYERSDSVDARDRAFRSALELNPGHPQAAQIRQVLESTSRE